MEHRAAPTWDRRTSVLSVLFVGASAAAYLAANQLLTSDGVAVWYPPAALALAYLVVVGPRGAPVVLLTRLAATWLLMSESFRLHNELVTSLLVVASYTIAAVWLRARAACPRSRLRQACEVVVGSTAGALVAATTSVGYLALATPLPLGDVPATVGTFWLGDASAVLTLAPLLSIVARGWGSWADPGRRGRAETVALAATVGLAAWLAIVPDPRHPLFYPAFVPLTWVALRRGLRGTCVVVAATGVAIPLLGIAVDASAHDMRAVQLFLVVFAVTGFLVGAGESDRAAGREALLEANRQVSAEQEASLRAEERLRVAFEAAPIGMALVSTDGRLFRVNPALGTILGYEPDELLARSLDDVTHPDDAAIDADLMRRLLAGEVTSYRVEKRCVHRDGSRVYVQLDVSLVRGEHGTPSHLIAQLQDISQRRAMHDTLASVEETQRASLDALEQGVLLSSMWGEIKLLNRSGSAILGYTAAELTALLRSGGWHTYDEDGNLLALAERPIGHTMGTGQPVADRIIVWHHRDGHPVTLRVATEPVHDRNGILVGVVTAFADITTQQADRRASEEADLRFRSAFEHAPYGVELAAPDGVVDVNPRLMEITGRNREELLGRGLAPFVHPDDALRLLADMSESEAKGRSVFSTEVRVVRPDGSERWVQGTVVAPHGADQITRIVHVDDITDKRAALAALADAEAQLRRSFEQSAMPTAFIEPDGAIRRVNAAFAVLLGSEPSALEGRSLYDAVHPEDRSVLAGWAQSISDGAAVLEAETRFVRSDGSTIWGRVTSTAIRDAEGDLDHIVTQVADVTETRAAQNALRASQARFEWQAFHDSLTGLPNRAMLLRRLDEETEGRVRRDTVAALLFVDLDNFKLVNDTLGHEVGDRVLMVVAERLARLARAEDTVARFGGDEFVILANRLRRAEDAIDIAERIAVELQVPCTIDGNDIALSASVGIALVTGEPTPTMLRDADTALYQAKENGRGRYEIFDESLRVAAVRRVAAESLLRRALDSDELQVHYQPIVDLRTGRILHAEALLRVPGPSGELQSPAEFIRIAEESGLIVAIGAGVLDAAAGALRSWRDGPALAPHRVAVNVSPRELASPGYADRVERILGSHRLEPSDLLLELTESTLIHGDRETGRTIDRLHQMGVSLAIDDFGTGYSSLAYLKRFPIDVVKIDRSFVAGLGTDPNDTEIVRAIVSLSRSLGVFITAEGVETEEQMAELRALGCDAAQGYLLARPVPAEDLPCVLGEHGSLATIED